MRTLDKRALHDALLQSRQYTKSVVEDLSDAQWRAPYLAIINPTIWEVGHVAWFMEHWCLRWRGPDRERAPSRLAHADRFYDSAKIPHTERWKLPLPSRAETLRYCDQVLADTLDALERADDSDEGLYVFRLALYHEDMHGEAFAYTRQTLAYPAPNGHAPTAHGEGDAEFAGGEFAQGAPRSGQGFVFDNEQWAHPVRVAPFAIARRPVMQAEFRAFVDDGGYQRDELWSSAGLAWRAASGASHPVYWRRAGGNGDWQRRVFDQWRALDPSAPMTHVSAHEAEAYCSWAGRRLPTEAEWEFAAAQGAIGWGQSVWEWTGSSFDPYPGFDAGPYAEYSAPWFGTHRSVRGGSFVTPRRLEHPKFRNFYEPHRADVFIGFRTSARR